MSRLGRKPVAIPEKVNITVSGEKVHVKGPLGELSQSLPSGIKVEVKDKDVLLDRQNDSIPQKALHGTWRKLIMNMLEGVSKGFSKELRIEGVGFRAQSSGNKLTMQLGYSHQVEYAVPAGIKVKIDSKQTGITVEGIDKQKVGQVAAEIRHKKKPEPYKGTGIRYSDERVRRKAGKAAAGTGGKK